MAKYVLFALLIACSGPSKTIKTAEPDRNADPSCPTAVAGTAVTVEDTSTGAALVFITTGDVAELRKRVAAIATTHNEHHGKMGPLPTGTEQGGGGHEHHDHGGGMPSAPDGTITVHSKATAEEVEGGAKLAFIAFPSGIAQIQGELRAYAQHIAGGTCH